MSSLADRVRLALTKRQISQAVLARETKLSTAYISQICNGVRTNMTEKTAEQIANVLGVGATWLIHGTGPMDKSISQKEKIANLAIQILKDEDSWFRTTLIEAILKLSPEQLAKVEAFVKTIAATAPIEQKKEEL